MVFSLVLPMAVQNLINVGVTAADVIMLGRVGETALSAASLAKPDQFHTQPADVRTHFGGSCADGTVLGKKGYAYHRKGDGDVFPLCDHRRPAVWCGRDFLYPEG